MTTIFDLSYNYNIGRGNDMCDNEYDSLPFWTRIYTSAGTKIREADVYDGR